MLRLTLRAYWELIQVDTFLFRRDFAALCDRVKTCSVGHQVSNEDAVAEICTAVDMACIWYWKEVRCLQRSAATVCLLKRRGVSAYLVVGAQQIPFRAHAWVESAGRIVGDKPYVEETYAILARY
jgi:hypothetical protein